MQVDFAVELGADDPVLEVPWTAPADQAGVLRYVDLKRHPEQLSQIAEAQRWPELGEFLQAINAPAGPFETAKCDVWPANDLTVEDEIFAAAWKFGGYIDVLFSDLSIRASFPEHEQWARRSVELLRRVPEIPASAEWVVRRSYSHAGGQTHPGYYFTLYLFGFGENETQARQQWAIALKLAANAMRQKQA
jgi:hypothetical protein